MIDIAWRFTFDVESYGGANGLEEHLEAVMTELQNLEVAEPSIDAELATGSVSIELVTAAQDFTSVDDFSSAVKDALVLVRTAIHAAGGTTHDFVGEFLADNASGVQWEQSGMSSERA